MTTHACAATTSRCTSCRSTIAARSRRRCSAGHGALTAEQTARDRRRQAGDLRRLQGGGRRRRAQGEGRHPRRRAVRRGDPARRRSARLHHRLPGGEERPGRVRLRVRRGLRARTSRRSTRRSARCWSATTRTATPRSTARQAARLKRLSRLPARRRPQPLHVRAAGPAEEGAACERWAATRRPTISTCGRGSWCRRSRSCRTPASSRTSGRSKGSTGARTASTIVAAARRGGRDHVGCIVLGRGEDDRKVHEWLEHRRQRAGLHRLRRRPDRLLGAAGRHGARGR